MPPEKEPIASEIMIAVPRQLAGAGLDRIPVLIADAGDNAVRRFIEYFSAHIRNKNTRRNYATAVWRFTEWCRQHGLGLGQLTPVLVATYVEQLMTELAKPTVKLHLAAIRMLFDYLVIGQVVAGNPASAVRGPKHVVKKGSTPVLTAEEARLLFNAIDTRTIAGLRDADALDCYQQTFLTAVQFASRQAVDEWASFFAWLESL